jgi:polysaccharide biosynthesis protein VpsQ
MPHPVPAHARRRWILALALYLTLIAAILWIAYQGRFPGWLALIPAYDKLGHAALMGTLGYLAHRALGRKSLGLGSLALPLGPLLVAALVLAEEFAQRGSAMRTFDLADLAADACGLLAVAPLDRLWFNRRHNRASERREP